MTILGRIPVLVVIAGALLSSCGGEGVVEIDDNGTGGQAGRTDAARDAGSSTSGSGGATTTSGGSGGGGGSAGADSNGTGGGASGTGGTGGTTKPGRDAGASETGGGGSSAVKDASPPPPSDAAGIPCDLKWPSATQTQEVPATIKVTGTYDGSMKRFVGSGALGTATQSESQGPLFDLAEGATLKNVVLGSPAADGVHCNGNCTVENVWWEDVGEDAATQKGKSSTQVMTISGGGAMHASDKIFQHNGPGTMVIKNFYAKDFGKLYRSCGNCEPTQYTRHVIFQNVTVVTPGASLAGINTNYMDTATFEHITICDPARKMTVCSRYTGNDTGAEPTLTGKGADGTSCNYSASDITWQ